MENVIKLHLFDDIWFNRVEIVEEVNIGGLDYLGPVNVSLLSSFGHVINSQKIL